MNNINLFSQRMTYASLLILAISIFTSITFASLSHILAIFPGIYFIFKMKDFNIKIQKSTWALIILTLICIVSVFLNYDEIENPYKNIFKTKYFIISILNIFSIGFLFRGHLTQKKIKVLIYLFLGATTIATISGLIALYSGFNPLKMKPACHATRACGVYGMYMTYGYGISLFCVLTSGLVLYSKQIRNYVNSNFLYFVFIINFIGMVVSYARGGWLGYLAAIPFFFFKDYKKKFFLATGSIILMFGLLLQYNTTVYNMFAKRTGSDTTRIAIWKTAVKAASEKPLFGIGYRNFEANVSKLKKKYGIAHPHHAGHGHSNYFEHLASTGILGLLALLAFYFLWLWELYKSDHILAKILFPTVLSFIFSGLFQYTFGDGENLFFIMGLYSLSMAIPNVINKTIYVE